MVMSAIPHPQRNELRANLLALSEACPLDHCNPVDCPLFPLRQMKPGERLQWFHALDEADLVYLATYHHICLTTKVESRLAGYFP
jgi:hypothetical protein